MSTVARLAAFVVLLLAVFGAAALAGGATDPGAGATSRPATTSAEHGDDGGQGVPKAASSPGALPGLAVAQDGFRLELSGPAPERSSRQPLRFRILDSAGRPVRSFEEAHEKRMHLIVVRRDLRRFQHLHPTMAPDGTWSIDADLARAGTYRVFADFTIAGEQRTLGADLQVPGAFEAGALPPVSDVARTPTGLDVQLRRSGESIAFDVLRDGRVVNDELEDYLGAKGHLVTLRAADLAYLHSHPDGDRLAFAVAFPSAGAYRLWVQFQLDGVVHTAAFTQEVPA